MKPTAAGRRCLIVNADDFGRNEAVNLGVAEGFRSGIVTSASLVANGPAFDSAVAMAGELPGLAVGIHLAANEYLPILPPKEIPHLVTAEGCFYSRSRQFQRMALAPGVRGDLLREWDAQISRIVDAGIRLTHIDGHGHCHAHPAAAEIVLELAERYGIQHVRLPAEPIRWKAGRKLSGRFAEKVILNWASQVSRRVWSGKLQFPQSFYGFTHGGRITAEVIRQVGTSVPPGVSELMVHVAVSNDQLPGHYTSFDFAGDLRATTTWTKQQFEDEFAVSLVTHLQQV